MMVPINGPVSDAGEPARARDAELRPRIGGAKASGSRRSSRRSPETCFSSKKLPATAASRLGSEGPRLSRGQESVTRARRHVAVVSLWDCGKRQGRLSNIIIQIVDRFDAGSRTGF